MCALKGEYSAPPAILVIPVTFMQMFTRRRLELEQTYLKSAWDLYIYVMPNWFDVHVFHSSNEYEQFPTSTPFLPITRPVRSCGCECYESWLIFSSTGKLAYLLLRVGEKSPPVIEGEIAESPLYAATGITNMLVCTHNSSPVLIFMQQRL